MTDKNRFSPAVETVEERAVPALLVQLDPAGNLRIGDGSAQNGTPAAVGGVATLSITQNANGTVDVGDGRGTNNLGDDLRVRGDIVVNLGKSPSITNVALNGDTAGGFVYNAAEGANTVGLGGFVFNAAEGANTVGLGGPGQIRGDLTLNTGNGADMIAVNAAVAGSVMARTAGRADIVALTGNIAGDVFLDLGDGADIVALIANLGNLPTRIGGNALLALGNGADSVMMGPQASVEKNLMIDAGNGNDSLSMMPGSEMLGNWIVLNTGNGADSVSFEATAPGALLVGFLGNGPDTFEFGAAAVLESHFLDGGGGMDVFQKVVPQIKWSFINEDFER